MKGVKRANDLLAQIFLHKKSYLKTISKKGGIAVKKKKKTKVKKGCDRDATNNRSRQDK